MPDIKDAKVEGGCRAGCMRYMRMIVIGFFVVVCGIPLLMSALGLSRDNEDDVLPTAAVLPSVTVVVAAAPTETETPLPTETSTNTQEATATALPETDSPTNTATTLPTATVTNTPTSTAAAEDTPLPTYTPNPEEVAREAFVKSFGLRAADEIETLIVNDIVVTIRFPLNDISAYFARREAEIQLPDLVCELREAGLTNRTYQITGTIAIITASGQSRRAEGVETIIPPDVIDGLNCADTMARMNINLAALAERYDVSPLLLEDD